MCVCVCVCVCVYSNSSPSSDINLRFPQLSCDRVGLSHINIWTCGHRTQFLQSAPLAGSELEERASHAATRLKPFLVCICEFKSWLQKLGALSCEWLLMFGGILWLLEALGGFKRPVMFVCARKSFTWLYEDVTEDLLQSDVEYYCLTVIAACSVSNLISHFLFYLFNSNRSFYLSAFKSDRRKDFICQAHVFNPWLKNN